jgi:phosphoglycolate phosphatase-like HAD superfamily hydrolase
LKPTIIFDLDGTLVDSLDDLQTAVNATLQSLARPAL